MTGTPIPPVAKREETRREYHGDVFIDPYEWLRDKANPDVIAYLEAENDYIDQTTSHLGPLRQQIFDEIKARTKETDLSVPTRQGDWWYYARTFEGKQYRVECRCPITDSDDWDPPALDENTEVTGEQILLDSNAEAEGHDFFALGRRHPHHILPDLGRGPPSRQGVAVSAGLGQAVGAGVSRGRRTVLAGG